MNIDIAIIAIFLIANLVIGVVCSRRIKSLDHFAVGHRAFSSFVIFATLSATFIGGGYTLGNASKVYSIGMIYAFGLLGFSLKEILVALFIAPRMDAHNDCLSIGDIIAKRYGTTAKIVTGIFSMIVCAGILGAQVGAMGAIFNTFLGIPAVWGIIIGFGIIIFYSSLGGMRAVVYTDIFQFIVLAIGIPLTFFVGLHYIGGVSVLLDKVPPQHLTVIQNKNDLVLLASLFVTFVFGETLVPPYVQRLFMAQSAKQTRNGTLASGILSIPFFLIVGAIGLIALVLDPNIDPNNALPFVVKTVMPVALRGFVIAGIISIIMSSAAGFLNAASIAFVNDIVRPLNKKNLSDKKLLWLAKMSTFLVGIGSVCFALTINNVLDILLYAYNFWAPVILVPLVAVIFNVNAVPRDFFVSATTGAASTFVWLYVLHQPFHISAVVIGVLASFIIFTSRNFLRRDEQVA